MLELEEVGYFNTVEDDFEMEVALILMILFIILNDT